MLATPSHPQAFSVPLNAGAGSGPLSWTQVGTSRLILVREPHPHGAPDTFGAFCCLTGRRLASWADTKEDAITDARCRILDEARAAEGM